MCDCEECRINDNLEEGHRDVFQGFVMDLSWTDRSIPQIVCHDGW
jgi:hypothetical protein